MVRLGVVVRLLMLAACLVPFTSPRQASAMISTTAPAAPLPTPVGEREEEIESDVSEAVRSAHSSERTASHPAPRATIRHARHTRTSTPASAPVSADPFRNGLGTPYRC